MVLRLKKSFNDIPIPFINSIGLDNEITFREDETKKNSGENVPAAIYRHNDDST